MSGLDFWSRRRAAVAAEEVVAAAPEAAAPEAAAPEMAEIDEAEALRELGLPEPETLGPGDDFAAFMGRAVPAALRRRALRRLWTTNPTLANLDAMVDYGGDFTDAALASRRVATAYEVGRGMARHARRLAEAAGPLEDDAATGLRPGGGEPGEGSDSHREPVEAAPRDSRPEPGAGEAHEAGPSGGSPGSAGAHEGAGEAPARGPGRRAPGDRPEVARAARRRVEDPTESDPAGRARARLGARSADGADGGAPATATSPGAPHPTAPAAPRRMRFAFAEDRA